MLAKGCSASQLKTALVNNDRATIFAAQQAAASTAQTKLLAEMKARLDTVRPREAVTCGHASPRRAMPH